MEWDSLSKIAKKVRTGELKAVDLVNKSLSLIDDASRFNAVIQKVEKRSLERAREIDSKPSDAGRLAGVPFIVKDNYLTYDSETTAASNILEGFKAPYQSTVVEKLEAEGAIVVAKANLDSFAHGASTENSDFGPTKNPHDETRVPGGSSGGSAAAVALGLAPFAMGSDTGGSIRLPASFTGTVGLKPTYGVASRFGVVAMASSTDVMGPITRTSEDAALVLDIIAGKDEKDSTTIGRPDGDLNDLKLDISKLKAGIVKEHYGEGVQPGVRERTMQAIDKLKHAGASVEEISLPTLDLALAVYYIVMPAEVSSNLGRYDGIRYGFSHSDAKDLGQTYGLSRSGGFNSEVKRRVMIGTYVLSSGYYDAYYNQAQAVRTKIIDEFSEAFKKFDVLLGPVSPTTAFKLGENVDDPLQMYLVDIMTVGPNIAGLPAISTPVGLADGLPVGLHIMAAQRQDRLVLALSKYLEQPTEVPKWN
ncbi:MAG: Asp-tRNA(Asn)/Glu-tRNA(Gln) amidotransferase subunit GatA [Candidatus Saccharimonadales bacterium]|nr:Asp-tRNA(Asn)/Glu-tRNA(Gln) amidotransferase subunit GatA [Candidatus Saccharimonadales bacterium]